MTSQEILDRSVGEKIGTCEHCGDSGVRVSVDNDRCEDCDGRFYPCSICKEEQFDEDCCRHIFQDRNFEWVGSGAWINPSLKKPLFRLFDLMPGGFAVDLRAAIKSGRFYTWLVAPLIGSGGSLSLNGMPERDGVWMVTKWGDAMIDIGSGDEAETTADAYHWLASLYEKKTLKANRVTIKWIDEYLEKYRGQP